MNVSSIITEESQDYSIKPWDDLIWNGTQTEDPTIYEQLKSLDKVRIMYGHL